MYYNLLKLMTPLFISSYIPIQYNCFSIYRFSVIICFLALNKIFSAILFSVFFYKVTKSVFVLYFYSEYSGFARVKQRL
ncbi:hypothetical protein EUGRSUZ_H00178 [Eucalyptus grandis]|uniref:Uncharacterized protein n=2 Tax=Eucalyptus grandis TaxID=71139 RepID=A0ACC3JLL7_EUCGR|nr:hypothetical protein EUGRSUZ_H00178 [Eucalyptus grandis]